jgi:hypothetical protein
MSKSAKHVWTCSLLALEPPLPPVPESITEPQYVNLIFERHCHVRCPRSPRILHPTDREICHRGIRTVLSPISAKQITCLRFGIARNVIENGQQTCRHLICGLWLTEGVSSLVPWSRKGLNDKIRYVTPFHHWARRGGSTSWFAFSCRNLGWLIDTGCPEYTTAAELEASRVELDRLPESKWYEFAGTKRVLLARREEVRVSPPDP